MTGTNESPIAPCHISIDKEGRWYHKGSEMIRRDIVRLFSRHMERTGGGLYVIDWNGQRCYVEVEDTAFVVRRAEYRDAHGRYPPRYVLYLSDDTEETLAAETLVVGSDDVLYCTVKQGTFPARFTRAAYYQLAGYMEEEHGGFFLPLNGSRHPVRTGRGPTPR